MAPDGFQPYRMERLPQEAMISRAQALHQALSQRRSVRSFSPEPIPLDVLDACLRTAGTAPSGANMQPWHFVVVREPTLKRAIRVAAEEEEQEFYSHRATSEWLAALAPLGTGPQKPFLESAPLLIAIFAQRYGVNADGSTVKHYYVTESVGIATGMLVAALHLAGLATLTHTPSPMAFLNRILERPNSERPFLLLVVGYPAPDAQVPTLQRKPLDEIATFR